MSKILTGFASVEEAPEADRQFMQVEEGKVYYVNDGLLATLDAQRKAERIAKAEAEKAIAAMEELKRLASQHQPKADPTNEPKTNAELEELKKSIATIQAEREREKAENQRLRVEQEKSRAAEAAGLRAECLPIFDQSIGHDEKGPFIKDIDGTAKIDPATGQRMTLASFYQSEVKAKPWAAKESGAGSGFSGSAGYQRQAVATATEIRDIKSKYQEAVLSGNLKAVDRLEKQAFEKGIQI